MTMQPFAPRLPGGLQQTLNNATTIGTPQMQPFQYNTAQQPEWFAQASQQMATQAAGAVFGNPATVKPPSEWDMGFGTGQAVEQAYSSALRMAGQSVFGGVPQQPNLSIAQQPFFNQPEQAAQRQGWADDATAQGYDWRTDPRYAGTDYSAAPEGSLRDRLEQQRQGQSQYGTIAERTKENPLEVAGLLALGFGAPLGVARGASVPLLGTGMKFAGQAAAGMLGSHAVQQIPGFENLPSPIQSAGRNAPYFLAGPGSALLKAGGVGTTVLGGEISESLGAGRGTGEFVGGFAGAAPAALIRGGLGAVRNQIVSRKAGGILDTLAASTDEADLITRLKGMDPMDLLEVNEAVMRANPELAKELGRALAAARAGDMQAAQTLKGALYGEATTLSKRVAQMTGEAPKSVRERAIGRVAKGLGGQKAGISDDFPVYEPPAGSTPQERLKALFQENPNPETGAIRSALLGERVSIADYYGQGVEGVAGRQLQQSGRLFEKTFGPNATYDDLPRILGVQGAKAEPVIGQGINAAKLEREAIKEFGTTTNPGAGGYLLKDGRFLDFSEGTGARTLDHRSVQRLASLKNMPIKDQGAGWEYMQAFQNQTGAIRWIPESASFDVPVTKPPTPQQRRAMAQILRENGSALVDLTDGQGRTIDSKEVRTIGELGRVLDSITPQKPSGGRGLTDNLLDRFGPKGPTAGIIDEGQQSEALQQVEYLTQKVAQAKEDLATQRAIRDANREAGKIVPAASSALDYAEKQSKAFGMQLAAARKKAGLPSLSQLQEEARAAADLAKNGPDVVVTPEMRVAAKGGSEIPVTQDPMAPSRGTQAQAPVSAAPETPPALPGLVQEPMGSILSRTKDMTTKELREVAASRGIDIPEGANKAGIVAALSGAPPPPPKIPPSVKGLSGDKLPPPPTSGTQSALDGFGLPEKSGLGSIADNLKAIPGALKYVQTSGDIAGVQFRQGAPLGWIDPKAWGRSLNRVVRAYAEDPNAAGVMEEVQRIRRFADGELLDIVDPRTGRKIVIKPMSEVLETNFQVPGMEKINDSLVMRLAQAVPLSGRSEKAMRVGYLGMATDLRNSMIDDAIRAGIDDQKLFNHYDDIAKLTVGYGDVPDKLRGLSDGFYSLRNIAARFQMVAAPFTRPGQVFKSPANMIKERGVFSASPRGVSTRNLARFAAGEMANLALLSHAGRASGLFEVGWNPLEPGFGVAKYTDEKGNGFAHDLMGGWGSFVKMGTRSLAALNGDERFNAIDEQMQFWRNKAGPVPGMIIDTIVENSSLKDAKSLDSPFSKNPLDPETWTSGKALEYISPFFSGDAIQSLISGALDVTDPTDLLKVAGHLTANITTGTGNIYQASAYTKRDKYAEDTYGVPWEELNALEMARITARMADEGVDFPYKSARLAAYNDGAPQTAFDELAEQYPILDGYDSMKEFRDENIAEGIKQGLTKNEAEKRVDAEINRLTIDTPAGPKNYEKLTQIIRMNVVERDRDIVNHMSDIPKYIEDYLNTLEPVE